MSTRTRATNRAGERPTSRLNVRTKWRSLMPTRRASSRTAVVGAGVVDDQLLGPLDRAGRCLADPRRRGELGLPAGAAEEHHELAGDRLGDVGRVVALDECERQIDPGGDPGRRPHVAGPADLAVDVDRIGVDLDVGPVLRQRRRPRPVRGHPVAVEGAGRRGEQRAGTHGDETIGPVDQRGDVGDGVRVEDQRTDAEARRRRSRCRSARSAGRRWRSCRARRRSAWTTIPPSTGHDRHVVAHAVGQEHRGGGQHLGRARTRRATARRRRRGSRPGASSARRTLHAPPRQSGRGVNDTYPLDSRHSR